jgi:hypothetical protein
MSENYGQLCSKVLNSMDRDECEIIFFELGT